MSDFGVQGGVGGGGGLSLKNTACLPYNFILTFFVNVIYLIIIGRNNGLSEQWVVGIMGRRNNGLSE